MFAHAVSASVVSGTSIWQSMFGFEIPATEKILRTLGVYLGLAIIMRLAGKRQLAQLNSFDLIVMLLLSNVVQNAVIGRDNSLTGGLLGAVVLVGFNAALERVATATRRTTTIFEGTPTTLVSDGKIVEKQVRRTGLRDTEVVSALRHQGASTLRDVRRATLEPGGSISVELAARQRPRPMASCVRPSLTCSATSTNGSQSSSGVSVGRLAEMVSPDDCPRTRRRTHGPRYSRAHWALARAASARESAGAGGRGMAQPASGAVNPSVVKAFSATRRWPSDVM